MANYENRLGEWFKQVEKKANEFAARKRADEAPKEPLAPPRIEPQPRPIEISAPVRETVPQMMAVAEGREIVADVAVAERTEETGIARPVGAVPSHAPALFEDAEISPVEDFFSFLSHSGEREAEEARIEEPPFDVPEDQGKLNLGEGTGTPRPIGAPEPRPEPVAAAQAMMEPAPQARVHMPQMPAPVEKPAPVPEMPVAEAVAPVVAHDPIGAHAATAEEKWERLPQHLRILFEGEVEEVAQHSYKTFRETRSGLIQRLLDPTISLEDAARILNVCPTTVRRYTNRGALKHYRTAGNQRRFRLSDVLAFMESKP